MLEPGLGTRRYPSLHAVGSDDAIFDFVDSIAGGIIGTRNGGANTLEVVGVDGAFPHVVGDLAIGRQPPQGAHPIVPREHLFVAVDFNGVEPQTRQLDGRL